MEAPTYYCRMCLAKDYKFEFIPMTGMNTHLKIKFEKSFGIIVSNFDKYKKHPELHELSQLDPMLNHLICPRCADKLTEIAMIHQMVHESNNFFKRQQQQQMQAGSFQNNQIRMADQTSRPQRFDTGYHPRPSTFIPRPSPFIPRHREPDQSSRNQRNYTNGYTDWNQFNGTLEMSDSEDDESNNNIIKPGRSSYMRNGRKL